MAKPVTIALVNYALIRHVLKSRDMMIGELSEKLEISISYLSDMLSGRIFYLFFSCFLCCIVTFVLLLASSGEVSAQEAIRILSHDFHPCQYYNRGSGFGCGLQNRSR